MHDFNSVSGMWSEIQLKGREGRSGGEGTNVEGIKRERGEECEERGGKGWVSCIPLLSLLSEGFWTGEGQQRGKEGGGEERDGGKGRGRCGFCLLPTFQSQS